MVLTDIGIPRIEKVLMPSSGHHVVVVQLDSRHAAKFPDKPWGLGIEGIGLPSKDSDPWTGYTLTEIGKPYRAAGEMLNWYFQKLPGPIWTTRSRTAQDLIPGEFRRFIISTRTKQEVAAGAAPNELASDLVSSVVEEMDDTGKALLVETTETIDPDAEPLLGSQAYVERQVVSTGRELVNEGEGCLVGLEVANSSVRPFGNGKAIRESEWVDSWVEHHASHWDDELGVQIQRTEQFVDPPTNFTQEFTSFQIVNEDRSLKIVENPPEDALASIHHVFPAETQVHLPGVLKSVGVVVTRNLSNGNSLGTGHQYSISNESSLAMSADLVWDIEGEFNDLVPAEVHVFYLKGNTSIESIASICNAVPWPFYRPKSQRLTISGCPLSQHVSASSSEGGQSISEGAQVGAFVNPAVIPLCLRPAMEIPITYIDATAPAGIADEVMDRIMALSEKRLEMLRKALDDDETMFGLDTAVAENATMVGEYLDLMEAQQELSKDLAHENFPVTVTPSTLEATNYTSVQPGRYLKGDCTVRPYRWGWVQVQATVAIVPVIE